MYFACMQFVCKVKTGPLHEHSPMLYDISGVSGGWKKVNQGMQKMYTAEVKLPVTAPERMQVLHKFPVIQHFLFGSILEF
mmetsp:Transcript_21654/g.51521  ORF Transcript_21654/g.51521 Transcript_21654/m.51521 type:complete len:80 (+) Transcript_21654:761-1000(+)